MSSGYLWLNDNTSDDMTFECSIIGKNISDFTVILTPNEYIYDGNEKKPSVTLKDGDKVLSSLTDYSVEYINNINAGEATVKITGKGNYSGEKEEKFTIKKDTITIPSAPSDKIYNGRSQNHGIAIPSNTEIVNEGSTISATNVGTYQVVLKLRDSNNYEWNDHTITNKNVEWKITKKTINGFAVTLDENEYIYDGEYKTPSVTVKDGSITLDTSNYNVKYDNNKNAGEAIVTITGTGNYEGVITETFTIKKRTVNIKAENKVMIYSDDAPTYTYVVTGNVQGEEAVSGEAVYVVKKDNVTISDISNQDVGSYLIHVSGLEPKDNYKIVYETGTLIINRKPIDFPTCYDRTYTGEEEVLFPTHTTGEYTNTVLKGTNVNNYTTDLTPGNNYEWNSGNSITSKRTLTCKIIKSDTTTDLVSQTRSYTGSAQISDDALATLNSNLEEITDASFTYKYYTSEANCNNNANEISAPINVGTYYVKAILTGTANYNSSTSSCVSLDVEQISGNCHWKKATIANAQSCSETPVPNNPVSGNTYTKCVKNNSASGYVGTCSCQPPGNTTNVWPKVGCSASTCQATCSSKGYSYGSGTCSYKTVYYMHVYTYVCDNTVVLSVSPSNLSLTYKESGQVSYNYIGDGNITCSSSDTAYVTCSVDKTNKKINVVSQKATTNDITITVNASNGTNYAATSKTFNVTVAKYQPTISLTSKNVEYTGSTITANTATVSLTNSETYNGTINYKYYSGEGCIAGNELSNAPTSAGIYSVKASIDAQTNYKSASKCVDHTITKSNTTTTLSNQSFSYTGSVQNPTGASSKLASNNTIIEDASYTYEYYSGESCGTKLDNAPLAAGKYSVKAILTGTSNYNTSTSNCAKYEIKSVDLSGGNVVISGANTWGQTLTATITDTDPIADSYTCTWYSNTSNSTSGGTSLGNANVSNKKCSYTISKEQVGKYIYVVITATKEDFNNKEIKDITDTTNNVTERVAKQNLTVTSTNYSGNYDGSAHGAKVKVTSSEWNGKTIVSGTSTSYGKTVTSTGVKNTDYALLPTYTDVIDKTIYYKVTGGDYYNDKTGTATVKISRETCNPPTNVKIGTDGKVTWTESSNASSYQISINNGTYANTTSGTSYLTQLTSQAGTKTVKVKSICSGNYTDESSEVSVTKEVYSVALTKGTGISAVNGEGNYISGATVSIDATANTGYTWSKWTQTSGGAQVSTTKNYTFTISGNASYTATATINNPVTPTISGGAAKVYNYEATTLTCATTTTYASGTDIYYEFGYATKSGGTITWLGIPSTTATLSIAKAAYLGTRYYSCRVYASNGTNTSSTVTSSNATTMTLQRVKVSFDATTNGGTLNGTNSIYVYYGSGNMYTTATGNTLAALPTASKEGWTWEGWYTKANDGYEIIDTSPTLKMHSMTINEWVNASEQWVVTSTSDKTLYAQFTGNRYTATFYYYSYTGSKIESITASCTVDSESNCTVYLPTPVSTSHGKYNSSYKGVTTNTSSMESTELTLTGDTTYYAYYSSPITIYYPTSSSVSSSETALYRNEYFTSKTAMGVVTSTSNSDATQATNVTLSDLYGTLSGLNETINDAIDGRIKPINSNDVIKSSTKTYYAVTTNTENAVIHYNSNTTCGSFTDKTANAATISEYYVRSTSLPKRGVSHGTTTTVPSAVSSSKGKYNSAYKGISSSGTTITNVTTLTGGDTYYAYYSSGLSITYLSNATATSSNETALYRNEYYSATTPTMTTITATSQTSTKQTTSLTISDLSGTLAGLAIENNTTTVYAVNNAANVVTPSACTTTYYAVSTYSVTYAKGSNVSAIGSTSGSCLATTSAKKCSVTLPSITANTGYTSVGWSTTNEATTGTAAGSSYELTTTGQTLYGNAKGNTYTATFYYYNGSAVTSKTAQCTVSSGSSCSATIPTAVTGSKGSYDSAYAGLSTSTGDMTEAVAANATTVTLSANTSYYAIYRSSVNIYRPTSTTACNATTTPFYRNQWLTSTSAISTPVLSTSTTGTENSDVPVLSGYTFKELRTAVGSGGTAYTVADAAKTKTTDFYARETATGYTITFNTNDNGGSNTNLSCTKTTYCSSKTAAGTTCPITAPALPSNANTSTPLGWSSGPNEHNDGTTYWQPGVERPVSATATYYAQTTNEAIDFSVLYDGTGGRGVTGISKYGPETCHRDATYNGVAQVKTCNFTLPTITEKGSLFEEIGWFIRPDYGANINPTDKVGTSGQTISLGKPESGDTIEVEVVAGFNGTLFCKNPLVYTGSSQTLTQDQPNWMKSVANNTGTNVGDYTVSVTLEDILYWKNGQLGGSQGFTCTIAPRQCDWVQADLNTQATSCNATYPPSNPVAGNTYVSCVQNSNYKYVQAKCNGTTFMSDVVAPSIVSSWCAGAQSSNSTCSSSNGGTATGTFTCTNGPVYYKRIYRYTCSS